MQHHQTFGDGFMRTRLLKPCRCPECREELIVMCPNHCTTAHEGATAYQQAKQPLAAATRRPFRNLESSRVKILAVLTHHGPLTAAEVTWHAGVNAKAVSVMLGTLKTEGLVAASLPPGRKRGARYEIAGRRSSASP